MKSLLVGALLCAAALPALAQTNVSISVGQPGFYGRIDLGDFAPRPVLYAPQPVIITPAPAYVAEPVYLRVPPGHRMHWARFCGRYNACGRPVLFVRDEWYTNTYVPRYREYYGHRGGYGGPREVRVVERVEYRDGPRHGHHGDWDRGGWDNGRHEGWEHGRGHGGGHGGGHGHGHDRD